MRHRRKNDAGRIFFTGTRDPPLWTCDIGIFGSKSRHVEVSRPAGHGRSTITDFQTQVNAAKDLDDLLGRLENAIDEGATINASTTDCDIDIDQLPKFAEDWPHDTEGMVSWDETRALWTGAYCDQSQSFAIGPRPDIEDDDQD